MILTEKETKAIQKMSVEKTIEVLDACKERLGMVSQKEYIEIMKYPYSRQNLVLDMEKGKIKSWKIGKIRYPILNDE